MSVTAAAGFVASGVACGLRKAGRDLALLHWAAAARHWIVLVLAAELFLPHPAGVAGRLAVLGAALVGLCAALALTETAQAKMRILLVPGLLGLGCIVALVGVGAWAVGGTA